VNGEQRCADNEPVYFVLSNRQIKYLGAMRRYLTLSCREGQRRPAIKDDPGAES
jgi:hypothetical protein